MKGCGFQSSIDSYRFEINVKRDFDLLFKGSEAGHKWLMFMQPLYIVWQEKNILGIPIIDEQHRSIVSTINTLFYFSQKGKSDQLIDSALDSLKEYTRIHFTTEEDMFYTCNYPEAEKHISYHREFAAHVDKMLQEPDDEDKMVRVMTFLKKWWIQHINNEDRKYVPYVQDC